jgi:hypothetical protein
VLVSRFRFARKFSAQSVGINFQRLAIQSWRGQSDLGKQILDRKYVPFSSCQTTLKNQKKNRGIRKLFSSALQAWKLAAQRLNKHWAVLIKVM